MRHEASRHRGEERRLWTVVVVSSLCLAGGSCAYADGVVWRDGFEDASAWKVLTADGVRLTASAADGASGRAIRLDYDFARGSGYGIIRRELAPGAAFPVPENYRFRWQMRGDGPRNTLEFKLVEKEPPPGAGESVWWVNQRDFAFAKDWKEIVLPKRKFGFAWGPSGGAAMKRIDAIEIVVTSFNGGKGTVWLDELVMEELPAVKPYAGIPSVEVSSRGDGEQGPLAINEEGFLGWRSEKDDAHPTATIDFGEPREFGGLVLEWEAGREAGDCLVRGGTNESDWKELAHVKGSRGGRDHLVMPNGFARRVRITCQSKASPDGIGLRAIHVLPPGFADSPNELFKAIAADSPRGWWPRYWVGEATYWTVIGTEGDANEALVSEDGAIELGKGGPSLEPFIASDGRLLTWNEGTTTQSLEDGYLPIPTVRREVSLKAGGNDVGLRLEVTCLVDDSPPLVRGEGVMLARYRVTNIGESELRPTLWLAGRPVQVNPTYQALNLAGGAAPVKVASADADGMKLDGWRVVSLNPATRSTVCDMSHQGEVVEFLNLPPDARWPEAHRSLSRGTANSAAIGYGGEALAPGGAFEVHVCAPLHPDKPMAPLFDSPHTEQQAKDLFDSRLGTARLAWNDKLNRVKIELPSAGQRWADCVRSNLAYILINRDGPGIQPGSRSYERTWIRDGALTSAALLALGHEAEVREFLDWFAPFQYDNGKIPCCVDQRGPDPVPEHDSHGEYIYAVMNYYRFSGDAAFLRRHWDRVLKAVAYIEFLRAQRMTLEFAGQDAPDEKRVLAGLMPESISHEGYSAQPMHSYWDDLWTLKGLEDAAEMAGVVGELAEERRIAMLRDSFRQTLRASIDLAMKIKKIDYIPGCAELGDFDATSTTIGVWPCDQMGTGGALADTALRATFEKYWRFFQDRRAAVGEQADWKAYTPYEWRVVGTMIGLGWRERAAEVAEFFFSDSRPAGWNHWAEVVWRNPRRAEFIGDMPHTWVGSDFINSFVAMFAHNNDRDQSLVLCAGVPLPWVLSPEGITIRGLYTPHGRVDMHTRSNGRTVRFEFGGDLRMPRNGVWLMPPGAPHLKSVRIDGVKQQSDGGPIPLPRIPVVVEVEYP